MAANSDQFSQLHIMADEQEFKFTYSPTCPLCQDTHDANTDMVFHWSCCSIRLRRDLRAYPSYHSQQSTAQSALVPLQQVFGRQAVFETAKIYLWQFRVLESIGSNDYLGFLQSLTSPSRVRDVIIQALQTNGNNLECVVGIEDALQYIVPRGDFQEYARDGAVYCASQKIWEVEWLKLVCAVETSKTVEEIAWDFLTLDRVRRETAPGRFHAAIVVWVYRLREARRRGIAV